MKRLVVLSTLLLALSVTADSWGATVRVPGDLPTIQLAIQLSHDGDTVVVSPGEYVISSAILFLGKQITVRSSDGAARTTIRMSSTPASVLRASVVIFENGEGPGTVLDGFTITGGLGSELD
jgi:hypothetical protein